ncbi:hypothetical protein CEXT_792441 [Caerostris extrusa]|uniref:Uncharacterized protein n=1 Tax=Caerostris extrusa TaxID=172846 RepID=A0AAV4NRC2_CAEEX|nr:hypothetical protein CEXT_792441 [Caerostris extrusa]
MDIQVTVVEDIKNPTIDTIITLTIFHFEEQQESNNQLNPEHRFFDNKSLSIALSSMDIQVTIVEVIKNPTIDTIITLTIFPFLKNSKQAITN